ncbi:MAG: hypothetical protein WA484_15550 [Solirubrobacteraceae bacterium]
MRLAVALLLALALSGCETTAEESARIGKRLKSVTATEAGLSITRVSTDVKVVSATVLHGAEGGAAVVVLRNDSSHALREVPIAIAIKDAGGKTLFQNDASGLEAALVSIPSLKPHGKLAWVDDQMPTSGEAASVSARVGQAHAVTGNLPEIDVERVHPIQDPANGAGAAGTVSNRSKIVQRNLVVFALARRAGRIVAAGRAVLPELAPGASLPFQVFFIGDPKGARLEASAPSTTLR